MGWVYEKKPANVKEHLVNQVVSFDDVGREVRVIDIGLRLRAAYMAIEIKDRERQERTVEGMVVLIDYIKGDNDLNFGTKWIHEDCGPVECDCPERILGLLTRTRSEAAKLWRERCANAIARRVPSPGTVVRFSRSLEFENGSQEREFTVTKERRRVLCRGRNGLLYRLQRSVWQNVPWEIVATETST